MKGHCAPLATFLSGPPSPARLDTQVVEGRVFCSGSREPAICRRDFSFSCLERGGVACARDLGKASQSQRQHQNQSQRQRRPNKNKDVRPMRQRPASPFLGLRGELLTTASRIGGRLRKRCRRSCRNTIALKSSGAGAIISARHRESLPARTDLRAPMGRGTPASRTWRRGSMTHYNSVPEKPWMP